MLVFLLSLVTFVFGIRGRSYSNFLASAVILAWLGITGTLTAAGSLNYTGIKGPPKGSLPRLLGTIRD